MTSDERQAASVIVVLVQVCVSDVIVPSQCKPHSPLLRCLQKLHALASCIKAPCIDRCELIGVVCVIQLESPAKPTASSDRVARPPAASADATCEARGPVGSTPNATSHHV